MYRVKEREGAVELGSDHNLIWCVVGQQKAEKVKQEERYKCKWKLDGRGLSARGAGGVFGLGRGLT